MIERWANLLASASTGDQVPPRFVGILDELSGTQAMCLEFVAFKNFAEYAYPDMMFHDSPYNYGQYWAAKELEDLVRKTLTSRTRINETFDVLHDKLNGPGCYLETMTLAVNPEQGFWSNSPDADRLKETDLHVLESLGLVRRVMLDFSTRFKRGKPGSADIGIIYYHLTELGVEFCKICAKPKVKELEAIGDESRAQNKSEEQ
jgi:hypothetical protein